MGIETLAPQQYSDLGKTFKSMSFNQDWAGSGDDSASALIAQMVSQDPAALKALGLTDADIRLVSPEGYQGDTWNPAQWEISDAARKALTGTTWNRTGVAGVKDGRSGVIRDSSGNILNATKAYSYDPAKDIRDNLLRGAAVVGSAYGLNQLLGMPTAGGGAATSGATTGGAASAGAGGAGGIAAGADPIAAYLTTGGAEGSILGNAISGAGGAAGAVGSGTFANLLGSLGPIGTAVDGIGKVLTGSGSIGGLFGKDGALGGIGNLLGGKGGSDWMKYLLPAIAGYASYKDAKKPTLQGYTGKIQPRTAKQTTEQTQYGPIVRTSFAEGGGVPRYLHSAEDGMEDGIGALIDGKQRAALSGGEFVIPADVVSHLGNGNSNAGAKQLYAMMDRIRAERTGTTRQGREINPMQMLPR